MLLKSSSTPLLASILSPSSDSPNRDHTESCTSKETLVHHHHNSKLSFSNTSANHHFFTSFQCSSSLRPRPASGFSPSSQEIDGKPLKGFRRVRSDGSLERFASGSFDTDELFCNLSAPKRFFSKHHETMLRPAPSFSIYNSVDEAEEGAEQDLLRGEALERSVTIGENIEGIDHGEFSFRKRTMGLIKEDDEGEEGFNGIHSLSMEEIERPASPPMYLAAGLGIDGCGFNVGDGVDLSPPNLDESDDAEEYYKKLLDEHPCHPLFLRNYAQLLQSKGDLHGAEDYYHRASLADPEDGEILSQYAKLVWQLHHDQRRTLHYFQRAARAAPQDSNVLAAYASFLWEIDDDDGEESSEQLERYQIEEEKANKVDKAAPKEDAELVSPLLDPAAGVGNDLDYLPGAADSNRSNLEECYRSMLEKDPCNSLVLRNYAQYLCQIKGDLGGAEEYYSRAILADPGDGEMMSQYAKLVWDLHRDHNKASCYFDKAVQATPGNSHVLAAYASFLWETEDEEDSTSQENKVQVPSNEEAVATANAQIAAPAVRLYSLTGGGE